MNAANFHVLADETRYRIVESLTGHPRGVGEIVDLVGIQQSGVSRHLRILQEAGFVHVRPDGTRRVYSLRPERFQEIDEWVSRYRALWDARLDRFDKAVDALSESPPDPPTPSKESHP
jgi:DNA-binding transcriptional ArsR family regulator